MSASCIYEGTIRHRRFEPRREFSHRLALAYLDLEELPGLLDGRLLARLPGLVRFRRRDYLGDPSVPLDRAVRELVMGQTGVRPAGPVRLLTHLRSFGHCFNPVSFYYCLDPGGERVQALVAEVTNTPGGSGTPTFWEASREALACSRVSSIRRCTCRRSWAWIISTRLRAAAPAETLSVHIASSRAGATVFDATLALHRRELTRASVAGITARYPLATVRVLALIYAHALGLKLAGVPVHRHPQAGRA